MSTEKLENLVSEQQKRISVIREQMGIVKNAISAVYPVLYDMEVFCKKILEMNMAERPRGIFARAEGSYPDIHTYDPTVHKIQAWDEVMGGWVDFVTGDLSGKMFVLTEPTCRIQRLDGGGTVSRYWNTATKEITCDAFQFVEGYEPEKRDDGEWQFLAAPMVWVPPDKIVHVSDEVMVETLDGTQVPIHTRIEPGGPGNLLLQSGEKIIMPTREGMNPTAQEEPDAGLHPADQG